MDFQEKYESGDTPWEIHRVDSHLAKIVSETPIPPCDVLDIGCGTGNDVIWLQQKGFNASGIDSSKLAVQMAQNKSRKAEVDCTFYMLDFFNDTIPGTPFDFIFDRGCFHHSTEPEKLKRFAENISQNLKEGGLWLTLTGSCDETRDGPGPPQLSVRQIVNAVEPFFEILSLISDHFDSNQGIQAKNWVCLVRKRKK